MTPPLPSKAAKRIDQSALVEHRGLLRSIERRTLLRGSLSLGALTMLTGCDVTNKDSVQGMLQAMSLWNDRVQAFLFSPTRLAPEFPASAVMKPPRWNAYIEREKTPDVDGEAWRVDLGGLVSDKRPRSLREIDAMPQVTQRTRHVCVEGWDYIGEWSGVPLKHFLESAGADLTAKYVGFRCADGYSGGIDMPTALHAQDPAHDEICRRDDQQVLRLSDPPQGADKARVQAAQADHRHRGHEHAARRLLGGSRLQLVQRHLTMPLQRRF